MVDIFEEPQSDNTCFITFNQSPVYENSIRNIL